MKHDILGQIKILDMTPQQRPYGLWESHIGAHDIAGDLRFLDVQWDGTGETLVWLERRSDRGVLVSQQLDGQPIDLATPLSVKASVGYGGGEFCLGGREVFFVAEGRLQRASLPDGEPRAITPPWGQAACPRVSPDGRWVVFVHSHEGIDVLACVDAEGRDWPWKLVEGRDFFLGPAWSPDGRRLAWVARDHPNMPWDGGGLYLADFETSGDRPRILDPLLIDGDPRGRTAISQPSFSPDGRLLTFLCDRKGWVRPWTCCLESGQISPLVEDDASYGAPDWVLGLRSYAWGRDSSKLYLSRQQGGYSSLGRLDLDSGLFSEICCLEEGGYSTFEQLTAAPGRDRLAWIGSSPSTPPEIASWENGDSQVWRRSATRQLAMDETSLPKSIRIPVQGQDGAPNYCYGLFYRPRNPRFRSNGSPPCVISIHGGPTGQFLAEYRHDVQYLCSRGFAVLELNFRGSSGFGKRFQDSLRGKWGVLDVEDVAAAAEYLSERGWVDGTRLALSGGSGGGLTALLCLIRFPGRFKAAVCRYAVTDLTSLVRETHKFEARYLDSLIGELPRAKQLYIDRSPVSRADEIIDPVAFYQGDEDRVVPKAQADVVVQSLQARGVPHHYQVFAGEGHGLRKRESIETYYRSLEAFLRAHVV